MSPWTVVDCYNYSFIHGETFKLAVVTEKYGFQGLVSRFAALCLL
jgi:hypothetical protein